MQSFGNYFAFILEPNFRTAIWVLTLLFLEGETLPAFRTGGGNSRGARN